MATDRCCDRLAAPDRPLLVCVDPRRTLVGITRTMVGQAARGLRDSELLQVVSRCEGETATQRRHN